MYIYLLKNSITGKCYVGQTINEPNGRFAEHRRNAASDSRCKGALAPAIRKYSWESFEKFVLQICHDQNSLNDAERYWVDRLHTIAPLGYNLKEGGGATGRYSDEARQKMSLSKIGTKWSEESIRKVTASRTGSKRSPDSCGNLSRAKLADKNPSAKLTWGTVKECRERHAKGEHFCLLATEFGVSPTNMSLIVRGKTWKESTNPRCAVPRP